MLYPHRHSRSRRAAVAFALLGGSLSLSGCLAEPAVESNEAPPPMCELDTDCPRSGQVCDEGICWGAPPAEAQLAAVITPPEGREDLALSELGELSIADDGTIEGLQFRETLTLSGRVVLADASESSIAAQVRIRRMSRIPGAPLYQRSAIARPNAFADDSAFSLRLPRFGSLDLPYQMTLVPDDGTLSDGNRGDDPVPAELAPPAQYEIPGDIDTVNETWVIGAPDRLKAIEGRVEDAAGRGIPGMRVTAAGRWIASETLERASTITTTDSEGHFRLLVPVGMVNQFVLTARPAPGTVAPTLTVRGVDVPDPPPESPPVPFETSMTMPSFPAAARYVIPVRAPDTVGGLLPLAGVEVSLRTELESKDSNVSAWFVASGVSDAEGNVSVDLIPGGASNRLYVASAQARASQEHGAIFDRDIAIGPPNPGATVVESIDLRFRTTLTGKLVAQSGDPIAGATVSARPSPSFRGQLTAAQLAIVDTMATPAATSDADGRFVLWLDGELFGQEAEYSLDIVPSASSRAPRWTIDRVGARTEAQDGVLDIGEREIPEPAYARGYVTAPDGTPVEGAVVTIYEIDGTGSACAGAGDDCVAPARVRAVATARADGRIAITLPRP